MQSWDEDNDAESEQNLAEMKDAKESLCFYARTIMHRSDYKGDKKDWIELTGVTREEPTHRTIKLDLGFENYFYVQLPTDYKASEYDGYVSDVRVALGELAVNVLRFEFQALVGARPYQFGRKTNLLKLVFDRQKCLRECWTFLENFNNVENNLEVKVMAPMFKTDPPAKPLVDAKRYGLIVARGRAMPIHMFETDVRPLDRFTQHYLNACGTMRCRRWIELPVKTDCPAEHNLWGVKVDLHARSDVDYVEMETDPQRKNALFPCRMLTIDIETRGLEVHEEDATVLSISHVEYEGRSNVMNAKVFTWNPHLAEIKDKPNYLALRKSHDKYRDVEIPGAEIINLESEKQVLERWAQDFFKYDPDILIGHNIYGFDLDFILTRGEKQNVKVLKHLGRNGQKNDNPRGMVCQRKVQYHGIPGRLQVDTMFFLLQFDLPQPSHTLDASTEMHLKNLAPDDPENTVFQKLLLEKFKGLPAMWTNKKGGVEGKEIYNYWSSPSYDKRHELILYCLKDSVLTLRLYMERVMYFKLMKMGEYFRAPCQVIMTSGKQEQVFPKWLLKWKQKGQFYNKYHDEKPVRKGEDDVAVGSRLDPFAALWKWQKYDGGLVRTPMPGKRKKPVAVFDFVSMYPSIMMGDKVCMSSVIPLMCLTEDEKEQLKSIKHIIKYIHALHMEVVIIQEEGVGFSYEIQEEFFALRKAVKAEMKKHKGTYLESVLDCEQLAIKIYMNGMYGLYAPRNGGRFTYLAVAAIITQVGQELNRHAGEFILSHPLIKHLRPRIVYGDTDSVMVEWDEPEEFKELFAKDKKAHIAWVYKISKVLERDCTASFGRPRIAIELEKIFYPLVLYPVKKCYAGLKYTGFITDPKTGEITVLPPENKPSVTGLEGKKRDRCEHLRQSGYRLIKLFLNDVDEKTIQKELCTSIEQVANGRVPLNNLVIVKGLSRAAEDYAKPAPNPKKADPKMALNNWIPGAQQPRETTRYLPKIAHVLVAAKHHQDGADFRRGSRIAYITYTDARKYVPHRTKFGKLRLRDGVKHSMYAEDYKTALTKKMAPDYYWYICNHYRTTLEKLLSPFEIDFNYLYAQAERIALSTANVGQHSIITMLGGTKQDAQIKCRPLPSLTATKPITKQSLLTFDRGAKRQFIAPEDETTQTKKRRK